MMLFLKFIFSFTLSFLILSIPISQRTLFSHISDYTMEYTAPIYAKVADKANDGIKRSKEFAKRLFSNSLPKEKESDHVRSQYSAPQKKYNDLELPSDSYTVEEKEMIRKLTENSD